MNALLFISLILLLATELLYEGKFGDKHGKASAIALFWMFGIAAIMGVLVGQWQAAFTYLLLRYALFDAAFGYLFRGSVFYLGSNWTDRIQKKFPHWIRVCLWVISFIGATILNFII